MTTFNAVGALLGRLREWWRRQEELCALDHKEVGLVAADLGISTNEFKDLIARGLRPRAFCMSAWRRSTYAKPTSTMPPRA
jgi:hypothetical protein